MGPKRTTAGQTTRTRQLQIVAVVRDTIHGAIGDDDAVLKLDWAPVVIAHIDIAVLQHDVATGTEHVVRTVTLGVIGGNQATAAGINGTRTSPHAPDDRPDGQRTVRNDQVAGAEELIILGDRGISRQDHRGRIREAGRRGRGEDGGAGVNEVRAGARDGAEADDRIGGVDAEGGGVGDGGAGDVVGGDGEFTILDDDASGEGVRAGVGEDGGADALLRERRGGIGGGDGAGAGEAVTVAGDDIDGHDGRIDRRGDGDVVGGGDGFAEIVIVETDDIAGGESEGCGGGDDAEPGIGSGPVRTVGAIPDKLLVGDDGRDGGGAIDGRGDELIIGAGAEAGHQNRIRIDGSLKVRIGEKRIGGAVLPGRIAGEGEC